MRTQCVPGPSPRRRWPGDSFLITLSESCLACLLALDVLNRIITLELLSSEAVVECRGDEAT